MGLIFKTAVLFFTLAAFSTPPIATAEPPYALPSQAELNRISSAIISTDLGDILIELYPQEAPWHVANFKYLADRGFYRGLKFHLKKPGYIIQGGSPKGDANSGPGYNLPPEFNRIPHLRGTLGMARLPDDLNPERLSHGSQFHILLSDAPHMNGSYTAFGRVVNGFDVLDRLAVGDKIRDIRVYVRG